MRNTTITKQRIRKNSGLIITTARHIPGGSLHALTRSHHTINKLTKKRPRAPQRPGTAHGITHHQQKSFPRPQYTTAPFAHPHSLGRLRYTPGMQVERVNYLHSHLIYATRA